MSKLDKGWRTRCLFTGSCLGNSGPIREMVNQGCRSWGGGEGQGLTETQDTTEWGKLRNVGEGGRELESEGQSSSPGSSNN